LRAAFVQPGLFGLSLLLVTLLTVAQLLFVLCLVVLVHSLFARTKRGHTAHPVAFPGWLPELLVQPGLLLFVLPELLALLAMRIHLTISHFALTGLPKDRDHVDHHNLQLKGISLLNR
jgi:hypothetical protein